MQATLYSKSPYSAIMQGMRRVLLFLILPPCVILLRADVAFWNVSFRDKLDDALSLMWSGKIDQGIRAVRLLAEKGDVRAQLFLGQAYAHANAIIKQPDYPEAMKWFKRASQEGSGEGSAAIAELYEQGFGVTKSSEVAKPWWELAAKQGYDQQELDVQCFTRTPNPERLVCEP